MTEGEELHLQPFVHIQREDEDDEGAERQNTTTKVERINLLDEGTPGTVEAHPETEMGELSEEANVIKASKTIDEALNEIDDSYWKHQQSKEEERTEEQPESTTQKQTLVGENQPEVKKGTKKNLDARKPDSEKQPAATQKLINPNPWAEHSHEAVNKTVSLLKEKNKKLKIEKGVEDIEYPALERVKREGVPIFLDGKGFQKLLQQ